MAAAAPAACWAAGAGAAAGPGAGLAEGEVGVRAWGARWGASAGLEGEEAGAPSCQEEGEGEVLQVCLLSGRAGRAGVGA